MAHAVARQHHTPFIDRRHPGLSAAESLQAARAAQRRERDDVFDQTGILILDDGKPAAPLLTFTLPNVVVWARQKTRLADV